MDPNVFFQITVLGATEITMRTGIRFLSGVYSLMPKEVGLDTGFVRAVQALMDGDEWLEEGATACQHPARLSPPRTGG